MKCEEAQKYLTALPEPSDWTREIEEAKTHSNGCRPCAEYVRFAERLQRSLEIAIEPSPHLLDAIGTKPQKRLPAWMEIIGGIPQMKKMAFSAATLAVAGAVMFGVMARPAVAAEPKATFKKMKKAVLAHKPTRQDGPWVVIDGKLINLEPGKAHTFSKDGIEITLGDQDGMMSEEMIKQIEQETGKSIEYILSGENNVKAFINGKEVDPAEANKLLKDLGMDLQITIDLDEAKYQDIRFGTDVNTLLLTPKGQANTRYAVQLDAKSGLPGKVTLEKKSAGKWSPVKQSLVDLASKAKKKA